MVNNQRDDDVTFVFGAMAGPAKYGKQQREVFGWPIIEFCVLQGWMIC